MMMLYWGVQVLAAGVLVNGSKEGDY